MNGFVADADVFATHLRNSIHFVALGLASSDTFRVEVKITYEFIPSTTFKMWCDTEGPRAILKD